GQRAPAACPLRSSLGRALPELPRDTARGLHPEPGSGAQAALRLVHRPLAALCESAEAIGRRTRRAGRSLGRVFAQVLRGVRSQRLEERREVLFVAAPALNRALMDGLAHLVEAGGAHGPCRLMGAQAAFIPRQAAGFEQAADLSLRITHQVFMDDID